MHFSAQSRARGALSLVVALGIAAACFPGDGGRRELDDSYVLWAVDARSDMALWYHTPRLDGLMRVPPTVFAAGWDTRHVIAKRHPNGARAVTEYYIIERAKDSAARGNGEAVTGPLTAAAFRGARTRLGVAPALEFTVVLHDLE